MCGILGIYYFDGERQIDKSLLKKMADTLIHRGPDDEGFYTSSGIGLGHRRLSIIDLESGKQPMANEDGSVQVVFNGEIYNFLELKPQLEAKGHVFRTRSDTETLIHGYEEWGIALVQRISGMFAF